MEHSLSFVDRQIVVNKSNDVVKPVQSTEVFIAINAYLLKNTHVFSFIPYINGCVGSCVPTR